MSYAKGTSVSPDKTFTDIRTMLRHHKATAIGTLEIGNAIQLGFQLDNRNIRFTVPLPERASFRYKRINQSKAVAERTTAEMDQSYQQATAERWRALLLVVKAKLESVESGIETLDQAFLAQLEAPGDPGRRTVGEILIPQIKAGYAGNPRPLLLTDGSA